MANPQSKGAYNRVLVFKGENYGVTWIAYLANASQTIC